MGNRHHGVFCALEDEERRGLRVDMTEHRKAAVGIWNLIGRSAEQGSSAGVVVGVRKRNRRIRLAGEVDDTRHSTRICGMLWSGIVLAAPRAKDGGQRAAGRVSKCAESVRISAVRAGVCA